MPVNKQAVLAAIRRNPQAFANAIMEQQVAAMMNPGKPGAIDPNAVTIEDIEEMVRERAAADGPEALRVAEGAIAMNRTFMGGVMGGMMQMKQELEELKAQMGNAPANNGKAIAKPARNAGGMARRHG